MNVPSCHSKFFKYFQGVRAVQEWKKHVLRTVNQNDARKDILENLEDHEILLERDWAMKFIPMQYRESQSNWFGKRGLSWHITVGTFRNGKAMEVNTHTIIHIFDAATQDAHTSNAILKNSLMNFQEMNPSLKEAYVRSDNAGCFHGTASISAMPFLSTKIRCSRMDFADPQGGKSICDRKASHAKSFIRRFVNEGNDVCTAIEFKDALHKSSMKNVTVVVALPPQKINEKMAGRVLKIPKITTLNNFSFEEGGNFRVWRQYGVGNGCLIPATDTVSEVAELPVLDMFVRSTQQPTHDLFVNTVTPEFTLPPENHSVSLPDDVNMIPTEEVLEVEPMSRLFPCPECTRTFQKYGNLQRHLDAGYHTTPVHPQILSDRSKIEYSKQMEKINVKTPCIENVSSTNQIDQLKQGWALKSRREIKRFTSDQKKYLVEKFEFGEKTGRKCDPEEIAQQMRHISNDDGKRRFSSAEFLTPLQIGSFFSRLVLQKRRADNSLYNEDDLQAEGIEHDFQELMMAA